MDVLLYNTEKIFFTGGSWKGTLPFSHTHHFVHKNSKKGFVSHNPMENFKEAMPIGNLVEAVAVHNRGEDHDQIALDQAAERAIRELLTGGALLHVPRNVDRRTASIVWNSEKCLSHSRIPTRVRRLLFLSSPEDHYGDFEHTC